MQQLSSQDSEDLLDVFVQVLEIKKITFSSLGVLLDLRPTMEIISLTLTLVTMWYAFAFSFFFILIIIITFLQKVLFTNSAQVDIVGVDFYDDYPNTNENSWNSRYGYVLILKSYYFKKLKKKTNTIF